MQIPLIKFPISKVKCPLLPPKIKAWGKLSMAAGLLVLFIYIIGPLGLSSPVLKPIADFIEENNINANGYYYTDVPEFSDAETYMRNSLGFATLLMKD